MEILKVNRINFLLWGEARRRGWSTGAGSWRVARPGQPSHISDMTVTPPAGCRGRGRPIVSAVRGVWPLWPGYETWNMNRVEPTNKTAKLRPAAPRRSNTPALARSSWAHLTNWLQAEIGVFINSAIIGFLEFWLVRSLHRFQTQINVVDTFSSIFHYSQNLWISKLDNLGIFSIFTVAANAQFLCF